MLIQKEDNTIILRCNDYCSMLVVDKFQWQDKTIDYNVSMQDSYIYSPHNTFIGRIKRAFKALFGKPVYYNDLIVCESDIIKLRDELTRLIDKDIINEG